MDGYTAMGILREKGYTKTILALTDNTSQENISKLIDAGCDDFLNKPPDQEQFNAMLVKYLSEKYGDAANPKPIMSELLAEGHEFDELIKTLVSRLPSSMRIIMAAFREHDWDALKKKCTRSEGCGREHGLPKII